MKLPFPLPTPSQAPRYMQVGVALCIVPAYIDYIASSELGWAIWPPVIAVLIGAGTAMVLLACGLFIARARSLTTRQEVVVDDAQALNFSSLGVARRQRVSDTRFVVGFSCLATLIMIDAMLLWAASIPAENIPIVIGMNVVLGGAGLYCMVTYFLWKSAPKGFQRSLQNFARDNAFIYSDPAVKMELDQFLEDTPYDTSVPIIKTEPKVYASLSGVYSHTKFTIASCFTSDYFGVVFFQIPTPLKTQESEAIRKELLGSASDMVDVLFYSSGVAIVFEHGIFADQASMRFYFNCIDRVLDSIRV